MICNLSLLRRPVAAPCFSRPCFYLLLLYLLIAYGNALSFAQTLTPPPTVFSGVTKPIQDITLSPEVTGTLSVLHVQEGEVVQKNQLLLELEHDLEELEVLRRQHIWKGKARLESSKNQADILQKLYNATNKLYIDTQGVSREEKDRVQLEYERAQGQFEQLLLSEQKEKIEYEIAQARLKQKFLRSPIHGVITTLHIQEGERCGPNIPVLRIVNIEQGLFVCNIEEKFIHQLQKGQELPLHIQSGSGWIKKSGILKVVKPVADPASGLVGIHVLFENKDHRILPGMPGRLEVSFPKPNH